MSNAALIDPCTDSRWDRFVENHPFGWICHLSGWKKVLEKSFPHMNGFYPALAENGDIKAGMPVYLLQSWIFGKRLVSIPYASLCDPLVSDAEDLEKLISAGISLSDRLGTRKMEIRGFHSAEIIEEKKIPCRKFYLNHYLDLDKDPEKLRKSFHRTCVRQKISRAEKSGLTMREAEKLEDVDEFYRLYCMTRKKLGLPAQPVRFFRTLWDTFAPSGKIQLIFAMKERTAISSLILFRFKDRVSAEYLGWNHDFFEISPNHFLFWESIRNACTQGYRVFDFGRTSPRSDSLTDFKNRWGTKIAPLPEIHYPVPAEEAKLRDDSPAYRLISKVCQNSPDLIFDMVGKFCYRHLG